MDNVTVIPPYLPPTNLNINLDQLRDPKEKPRWYGFTLHPFRCG